jgi:hypothetical protein
MKKTIIGILFVLFVSVILASPIDDLNSWAKQKRENITVEQVVKKINSTRAEGDITFGSEYVFNPGYTWGCVATTLDANTFVVAYDDEDNSTFGTAIVGSVNGTEITFGAEYVFNANWSQDFSILTLDSNRFLVCFRSTNSMAMIGTVSGNTISFGSQFTFNAGNSSTCTASLLDPNRFVVVYQDQGNSNYHTAIIGTISGSDITFGSEYVFNTSVSFFSTFGLAAMNSTYGYARVGVVSGNDIAFGTPQQFNLETSFMSMQKLDSTHIVIAYEDYESAPEYGTAIVGTVTGTELSFGDEYIFSTGMAEYVNIKTIDSTHFLVTYQDFTDSGIGKSMIGFVSGTTITYGSEFIFNLSYTYTNGAAILDNSHFVVAFTDDEDFGAAVIGEMEIDSPLPVTLSSFSAIQTSNNFAQINWTTQSETNLLGYNLYRNIENSSNGSQKINQQMIYGENSANASNYSYTDETVDYEQPYFYWLESVELSGNTELFGPVSITLENPENIAPELPNVTHLQQNYPNPFNPTTTIKFSIQENETGTLSIFNAKGQLIESKEFSTGEHSYHWNADNLTSGIYFYKLQTKSFNQIKKMILMK